MQKITIAEWRWLALVIAGLLLISSLPQIVGSFLTTPNNQYPGVSFNPHDAHTYLAKIEEGRAGEWVFRLVHTGEKDDVGAFIYIFYLLLGKVGTISGLNNILIFHIFRLICASGMLIIVYRFIALFFSEVSSRRFAFLVAALASGVGWLAAPLGITSYIPESLSAETFTFFQLLASPHFAFTVSLLFLTLQYTLYGLENRGWLNYLWAALTCFGATLNQAFLLVPLAALLGIYWVRLCVQQKRLLLPQMLGLLGIGISGAIPVLLVWISIARNPVFAAFMKQNIVVTDGLVSALVTFGFLIPLTALGIWWVEVKFVEQKTELLVLNRWRLLSTWAIVSAVLIFAPLDFNKRLSEGVAPALACLSVLGWEHIIVPILKNSVIINLVRVGLVSLLSLTPVVILIVLTVLTISQRETQYYGVGEQGAFEWLRQNGSAEAIVLSDEWFSNVLPAQTKLQARPFYGHPFETLNAKEKWKEQLEFYNSATTADRRSEIIKKNNLTYLVHYPPRAKLLGDFEPANSGWPLLFERNGLKIYKLTG